MTGTFFRAAYGLALAAAICAGQTLLETTVNKSCSGCHNNVVKTAGVPWSASRLPMSPPTRAYSKGLSQSARGGDAARQRAATR
ncbi:MAG: hypothetical protein WDO18_11675 [Acidobacteriota bacterium]